MSSHKYPSSQFVDLLIVEALRAQVGDAEPSPHVWERIWRRARAWSVRRRCEFSPWNLEHVFAPVPIVARGGLVSFRTDLVSMRFLDYAAMLFRFGW